MRDFRLNLAHDFGDLLPVQNPEPVAALFRPKFQAARSSDAKAELATEMLNVAAEENDPATRYGLLVTALDIAVLSGDHHVAMSTVESVTPTAIKTDATMSVFESFVK